MREWLAKDPAGCLAPPMSSFLGMCCSRRPQAEIPQVDYLYKTLAETLSSADYIQTEPLPSGGGWNIENGYREHAYNRFADFSRDQYAGLIFCRCGFDTYVNQDGQQRRLFAELNEALKPS